MGILAEIYDKTRIYKGTRYTPYGKEKESERECELEQVETLQTKEGATENDIETTK